MDFLIGFAANVISTTLVNPIDVIKTRYQVNNLNGVRQSVPQLIKDIYNINGPRGFYRGLLPNISTYPIFWSIFFGLKGTGLKDYKFFNSPSNEYINHTLYNKYANKSISTLISASIASTITNPIFVVKTKLQTIPDSSTISISGVARNLYKEEGYFAYFRGLNATLLNNSKLCIQFPMIDYFKEKYEMNSFTAALIARTSMTALFYPLDNIRTNQRNSVRMSLFDVSKQIYRNYGLIGFYRGVLLYSMTSTPNFVIMVTIKELLEEYLNK